MAGISGDPAGWFAGRGNPRTHPGIRCGLKGSLQRLPERLRLVGLVVPREGPGLARGGSGTSGVHSLVAYLNVAREGRNELHLQAVPPVVTGPGGAHEPCSERSHLLPGLISAHFRSFFSFEPLGSREARVKTRGSHWC